jgi:hypothetical protein
MKLIIKLKLVIKVIMGITLLISLTLWNLIQSTRNLMTTTTTSTSASTLLSVGGSSLSSSSSMRSIHINEGHVPAIAVLPLALEREGKVWMANNPTHKSNNNNEGSPAGGMVLLRRDKEQPASLLQNDKPRPAAAARTAANDPSTTSRTDLPYFVLHVGPAKTSNKKLQREFTAWKDVLLQQDNYIYGGKFEVPQQPPLGPSSSSPLAPNMTSVHRALLLTSKCPFSWRLAHYKYNQKKKMKRQRQPKMIHTNDTHASNNATAIGTNTTATTKRKLQTLRIPPCWKALQKQLDSWQGHNVLLSDEEWSLRFFEFAATSSSSGNTTTTTTTSTSTTTSSLGPQPIDWIYLLDALQGRWQVVVVVGYRYLYDWLPAALYQDLQWAPHKPKLNRWPGTQQGGRDILPLMTSLLSDVRVVPQNKDSSDVLVSNIGLHHSHIQHNHHRKNSTAPSSLVSNNNNNNSNIAGASGGRIVSYWDTLDLLKALHQVVIPHNIDIRVFHIPAVATSTTSSIRTSFFCNVLPQATHACHASQWMDDQSSAATTQKEEGERERRDTRRQELFFDALALSAAANSMVDVTRLGRHDVTMAVQDYYRDESIRRQQQQLAPNYTFPLDCPSQEEYEALLQGSLNRERQIRTLLTNTSISTTKVLTATTTTNTPSWNETHHVESYWQAVRQDQFCWINTSAVLFVETVDLWKSL